MTHPTDEPPAAAPSPATPPTEPVRPPEGANIPKEKLAWLAAKSTEPPATWSILIRKAHGTPSVVPVTDASQVLADGGRYAFLPEHRLYFPEGIPPNSHAYIHAQGDPEPFSGRDPVGMGSYDFETLAGDLVERIFGGAWEPPPVESAWPAWVKWAALAVGALLLAFGIWWFVWG